MANVPGEKNVAGSVKIELADAFLESVPPNFKKKHVFAVLFQIWLTIPETERIALLAAQKEGISLEDLIEKIVNRVLAQKHHEIALGAVKVQKHKKREQSAKTGKSA
jgi:hypothetical protein